MNALEKQRLAFKRSVARQPVLERARLVGNRDSGAASPSPSPLPKRRKFDSNAGGGQHVNSQVYALHKYLQRRTITRDDGSSSKIAVAVPELEKKLDVRIMGNEALLEMVRSSPSIHYDQAAGTMSYVPSVKVSTADELAALLRSRASSGLPGLTFQKLQDSFAGPRMRELIDTVEKRGDALVVRKGDEPQVVFYNSRDLVTPMDPAFVEMWATVGVPDDVDIERQLKGAGLKTLGVSRASIVAANAKKKEKKRHSRARKVKITNTHLEIDLFADA